MIMGGKKEKRMRKRRDRAVCGNEKKKEWIRRKEMRRWEGESKHGREVGEKYIKSGEVFFFYSFQLTCAHHQLQ